MIPDKKGKPVMDKFMETVRPGQTLADRNGNEFQAVNPHVNTDEPDHPFIVYDENGNSYFAEDIDVEKSILLNTGQDMEPEEQDGKIVVFSKFHIPKDVTSVQAAIMYTRNDGKTWSSLISAEHTVTCPAKMECLCMEKGQSLIEDTWRDGFNTCLELFQTGRIPDIDDTGNMIKTAGFCPDME